MKQVAIIALALAFASGCATQKWREECETKYPDEAKAINQCIDARREDTRAEIAARREDREAEKAACLWPKGVWVAPSGPCLSPQVLYW